jgi:hypothetical protein
LISLYWIQVLGLSYHRPLQLSGKRSPPPQCLSSPPEFNPLELFVRLRSLLSELLVGMNNSELKLHSICWVLLKRRIANQKSSEISHSNSLFSDCNLSVWMIMKLRIWKVWIYPKPSNHIADVISDAEFGSCNVSCESGPFLNKLKGWSESLMKWETDLEERCGSVLKDW